MHTSFQQIDNVGKMRQAKFPLPLRERARERGKYQISHNSPSPPTAPSQALPREGGGATRGRLVVKSTMFPRSSVFYTAKNAGTALPIHVYVPA